MKMKMYLKARTAEFTPVVKRPVDVFKNCPECDCSELLKVDGDLICSSCDWNSIVAYADALFDQGIGYLFESEEAKRTREQERQKRIDQKTERVLKGIYAKAKVLSFA